MGKHTSLDNDEFDQAYYTLKTIHKNHSRHIASLFLITILLTSVSLFAPYPAHATGTFSIDTAPGLIITDSTNIGETVVVTVTRTADWPSTNSIPLHVGSSVPFGVTFTADGTDINDITTGSDHIQPTVTFTNQADQTATFNLHVKTAAVPFGSYEIFVDGFVNTGDADTDAFEGITLIVGDSSTPAISVIPPDGPPGQTNMEIEGFNFNSGDSPVLYLTDPVNGKDAISVTWSTGSTVPSDGMVAGTFTIPGNSPAGMHELELTAGSKTATKLLNVFVDGGAGGITASVSPTTLNLPPPPDTSLTNADITLGYDMFGNFNPAAGVNFTISGMPPGMTAFWSDDGWSSNTAFSTAAPVAANATHNIQVQFKTTANTPSGGYPISILAFDKTPSSIINQTASVTLSVPPPMAAEGEAISGTLTLSPASAEVGDTVTFSGNIGAQFDGAKTISMMLGGSTLTTSPSTISAARSASASSPTVFSGSFVVPNIGGTQPVKATLTGDDSNVINLNADLTILNGQETYTASMSPSNLPPIEPGNDSETVTITVNGVSGKAGDSFDSMISGLPPGVGVKFTDEGDYVHFGGGLSQIYTIGSGGTNTKTFQLVTTSAAPPGAFMVNVDVCNHSTWNCQFFTLNGGILSSGGFASVFLSETFVEPGDSLTVTAAGFTGSENLNVILNADTIKTATASSGSATISITVPSNLSPGGYPVQVVGVTSGKTASSFLDVFSTIGDDAKKFTVSISPTTLPPLQQGSDPTENSNMTITVNALPGQSLTNGKATVTILGLPFGVQGGLEVGDQKEPLSYSQFPSIDMDVATGSSNNTKLSFKVDDFSMLGPIMASVEVVSGSNMELKQVSSLVMPPFGSSSSSSIMVNVVPPSFMEGDTVSISAYGFDANENVAIKIFGTGGDIDITPSGTPTFSASGNWTGTVAIPTHDNLVSGHSHITIYDTAAGGQTLGDAEIQILDSSSLFSLTMSPNIIPPIASGATTDVTFTIKALSGKDPGSVELGFPWALPYGITGCFDVDANEATVDCTNASNLVESPTSKVTPSTGGSKVVVLKLKIDNDAQSGPFYIDLKANSVKLGSSSSSFDYGSDQEIIQFVDSHITGDSNMGSSGFASDGWNPYASEFVDFGAMQTNFASQYGADSFNAFTIASLTVTPTSGASGDSVTLSASNFNALEKVDSVYFAGTNITSIPKSDAFSSSGGKSWTIEVPSGIPSGYHGVDICSETGKCAFTDFYVVSGSDVFNAFSSPSILPSISAGENTASSSLIVESMSGKSAGTVTMKVDYLPNGVQACFGNSCSNDSDFEDAPLTTTLTPKSGGKASTKITYKTDDYVTPGPKWIDVIVTSSANSQQQVLFADFDVKGKQTFFDDSFQNMFSGGGDYAGGDYFNAFTIGSLSIKPNYGVVGDSVTISASQFAPNENIQSLFFGDKLLPIPTNAKTTDANGEFTATFAVPTGLNPGMYPVDIISASGKSAYTEFNVIDANAKFTISTSQQFLPPFSAGGNSESIAVSVTAVTGAQPGNVTLTIDSLPEGVTAKFGDTGSFLSRDSPYPASGAFDYQFLKPLADSLTSSTMAGLMERDSTTRTISGTCPDSSTYNYVIDDTPNALTSLVTVSLIGGGTQNHEVLKNLSNLLTDSSVRTAICDDSSSSRTIDQSDGNGVLTIVGPNANGLSTGNIVYHDSTGQGPITMPSVVFDTVTTANTEDIWNRNATKTLQVGEYAFFSDDVNPNNDGGKLFTRVSVEKQPTIVLEYGGPIKTAKTTLTFKADEYAPPGPMFTNIIAYTSEGSNYYYQINPVGGNKILEIHTPLDGSIGSKSNFGGFMTGSQNFMGDSSAGFVDFSTMQDNFADTYGANSFNAFTIADLFVNPSAGEEGSSVTLSATGFSPGVGISNIMFGSKNIPVPSNTNAELDGSFSQTIAVPSGLSGYQPIDVCTANGVCAFADFKISSDTDKFIVSASPGFLEPVHAGQDSEKSTITVKSMTGKDPGTVTLSIDMIPWGVTADFNSTGTFSSKPTIDLKPGLGGSAQTSVQYRISDTAPPGPVWVDVRAESSTQTEILFLDTAVMPKTAYFDAGFTDMFADGGAMAGQFNAFTVAGLVISPSSAAGGDQVTLTASGFNPGATVENLYFGPKTLPLPSGSDTFSSSGVLTTKLAVPTGLDSGHYPVDICTTDGMCSFTDFYVASSSDLFTVDISPKSLPAISAQNMSINYAKVGGNPNNYMGIETPPWITQNSTLSVKAMSGKDAGNVTLAVEYLPPGVTARFNKTLTDGTATPWETNPTFNLAVGTGGKNSTTIMFMAGPDSYPGPLYADVIATTDKGTQSLFIPIDSAIMPKADFFNADFTSEFGAGGDFDGMENLFKIASMSVKPSSGAVGDSITVTGSGFTANSAIDLLRIGSQEITLLPNSAFKDGAYSESMAIPSLSSGHWEVELCDDKFICAFNEIFVTGSDDLFTVTANPQYLEAAFPGVTTNSTKVTVNALSGSNAGNVTLTVFGLPPGVTSNFDGVSAASTTIVVGTGGTNSTTVSFDIASNASPGPAFVDIEATSDQGSQTFFVPIDFGILPNSGKAFFDNTFKSNYAGFFPFKVGMVTLSSTAGSTNSSLTLSASGFAPNAVVDELIFGNHTVALPTNQKAFDSSGSKKLTLKVPNQIASGFHAIDLCTTDFMCAGDEFFVTGSSDLFKLSASPESLPPAKQGEDSESIVITAEALSGKNAGTVTLALSGLPSGVTAKFDGTASTTKDLVVGYGGKASTSLKFAIANTVSPGPVFFDVTATTSAGSQVFTGTFDFGVMPDFDAGGTLDTFINAIPAGDFNPFEFGSLIVSPTAAAINGTVKLTASGFTPNANIAGPEIVFGNHTLALLSSDSKFDASGMYSTSIAVPNMYDGNYNIQICDAKKCADAPFEMISSAKTFSLDVSPQKMPPALQGQVLGDSDVLSISLKAFKGKTPGVVTVEIFGLPEGVNSYLDINDGSGYVIRTSAPITLGLGESVTVKAKFVVDEYAAPNSIPIFIEAIDSTGNEIKGKSMSFGVVPKATFAASLGVGNLVLEPNNNATQNTVTLTASGFTASDPITIFWGIDHDCDDGNCDKVDLPAGTTFDSNGFYSQTISIKNVTSFGVFPITIKDNSQRIVTEEFKVVKSGLKFSNTISENSLAPVSRGDATSNSTLTIESLAGLDSDAVEVSFIGLPAGFTPILDGTALTGADTVSAEGGDALGKSFNPALGNLNKTNIAFDTASTTVPGVYHITVNVTDANQITTLHDLEINVKPSGTAADDFAQLSLSSLSGIENSTLTIAGKGFTAANTVSLEFGTSDYSLPANTAFDSSGTFSTTIKIPGVVAGDYPITLSDGIRSATEIFTILGTTDKYSISVSPSNLLIPPLTIGTASTPLKFSISSASGLDAGPVTFNLNYTSHPEILLKWNSSETTSNTNMIDPGFGQTVSSELVLLAPTGIHEGNGDVVINLDVSDGTTTKFYSLETSIIPAAGNLATCTIAPSKTSAGSAVTVFGSGFTASSAVSIDPLKMAGTSSSLSFGETITTSVGGVFSSQFTVPATIGSVALEGSYEFHISDAGGKSCHADIFVIPDNPVIQTSVDSHSMITEVGGHINATLSVTSQNELSGDLALMMTSLPPGVTANVTSTNGTIIANYHGMVSGTVNDPIVGKSNVFAFTPGSPQLFNVTFNIPDNLKPGPYNIKLGANSTDQVRAESLTLQITDKGKSGLSTFPSNGLTESQVSVEGSGFGSGETITLKFDGLSSGTSGFTVSPGTITTTSTGVFNGTITIPTLDAGLYGLFAEGTTSLKNTTSQFTITPNTSTFALEISPKQVNLKQGDSGTYDVALIPMAGFSSNVTLSITGLPDGITSSLQPTTKIDPLNGIASPVTLSVSVPTTKSVSSYTFSIVGTADNGLVVTERANIKVQQKTGGNMGNPLDMEKDSNGHLLIIDAENCQVQKFGENGTFIDAYGSCGNGDLEFDFEHGSGDPDGGIDIDSDGNIYIADTGNDRVVKLNSTGGFVKTIGTAGTNDGEFTTPVAIEIDSNDNLWVTDEGDGGKIVKYSTEGVYGSLEINNDLTTPASVASNSTHLVVVDTDDDEVKTYKISDGNVAPATTFGGNGSSTGQLFNPVDVELDSSGNIFVVEEGNDRIQKFDNTGNYKALVGNGTSATFNAPTAIVLDNDGDLHIANTNDNSLAKIDVNELVAGTGPLKSNSTLPAGNTAIGTVAYSSTNSSGYVLTTDTENDRVKIYDDRGNAVDEATIDSPVGIAQNSTGFIFVAQNATNTIKILHPDGSDTGDELGSGLNFANLEGLTIDSSDNIVVVDKGDANRDAEIVKISQDQNVLLNVTGFTAPRDVAIDSSGNIYATEANSGNVTKLDSTGTQVWSIGGNGTADGKFDEPSGIDIDASGNVYIADTGNDRLQKIDSDGQFLNKFDASDGDGLSSPTGLAIKDDGTIIVAESGGDEIEEIQTTANFETSYGDSTYGDFTVEAGPKEVVLPDVAANSTVFEIKIQTDGVDKTKAIYVDFDVPKGVKLKNAASGNSTELSTGNQLKLTIDSDTGLATGNVTIARNSTLSEGLSTLTMKTMVEGVDPMSNSGVIYNHKNTTLNIIGTSSTTSIESETSAPVTPSAITGTTPLNISADFAGDDADVKIVMKELTTDSGDPITIDVKNMVMQQSTLSSEDSFTTDNFEHVGTNIINVEPSSKSATTNYDIKMPVPATLPDGMTADTLKITWFDDANGDWVELPSTVSGGFVTATVDHFSSFGMGGSKSGSGGGAGGAGGTGGGGGGGGGTGGGGSGAFFVGGNSGILTSLKIYEVSYDVCNDKQVEVIVGANNDDVHVKLRSPIGGVTYAQFETHLTSYSTLPGERVLKFVAPIHPDDDYVRIEVDQISGRTSESTVKSLNIYGCEGSEIVTIPEVFAESSKVTAIPVDSNSFKSTPINGGEFIQATLDKYDFNIWYLMNGKISSLDVDENNNVIGLDLDNYVEGTIALSLSRSVIDAENDNFVIMSIPLDIDRYEIVESTETNVIFEFTPPTGTERIEIYGSKVVPEFGSLVFVILLISILSAAMISRKTSLSFR